MGALVTLKTAKIAKEKGFKSNYKSTVIITWSQDRDYKTQVPYEPKCFLNGEYFEDYEYSGEEFKSLFKGDSVYSVNVQIPTLSNLQTWLREERNIDVLINKAISGVYMYIIWKSSEKIERKSRFYNYEKCLEIGLKEALQLVPSV